MWGLKYNFPSITSDAICYSSTRRIRRKVTSQAPFLEMQGFENFTIQNKQNRNFEATTTLF